MSRILVTDCIPMEGLKELFEKHTVTYSKEGLMSKEAILKVISEYDAILPVAHKVDKEIIDKGVNLKMISSFGAGFEKIDIDYATEKGIIVTNTPYAVTEPTANLTLGLMLAVTRRISELDRKLRQEKDFTWGTMFNLGHSIEGKTLGILGFGRIGKAVAKRGLACGMKVVYFDEFRIGADEEKLLGVSYASFEELLRTADVISIHVPLMKGTYHLIGKNEMKTMKKSAYIINAARGPVIDEAALVDCLADGTIAGAGMDVFESEPAINPELLKMDQVVMVPHIGTATIEARTQMASDASRNLIDFFEGRESKTIINPKVIGHLR